MDFPKQEQYFHLCRSSVAATALSKCEIKKKGINNYIYLIYLKALVKINPDNKDETYKDFYNV